ARYTGFAASDRLAVAALHDAAPEATLGGRIDFDLTGASMEQLDGPVSVRLDSALAGGYALDGAPFLPLVQLTGRLDDGLFIVDTARATTDALTLAAGGSFGVLGERTGTLELTLSSASLTPFEAQLFDELRAPGAEPRIAGELDATIRLTGGLSAFDLDLDGTLRGLVYERHNLESGRLLAQATAIGTDGAHWDVRLAADSLVLFDARLDSLRATVLHENGATYVTADARGRSEMLAFGAHLTRTGDTTTAVVDSLIAGIDESAWRLEHPVRAVLAHSQLSVDPFRIARNTGSGFVEGGGSLAWGLRNGTALPLDFTLGMSGLPFHDVLQLVGLGSLQNGALQGNARLTGTTASPYLRGGFAIDSLQVNDARLARVDGIMTYRDEVVEVDLTALHGARPALTATGRVPYDLRLLPVASRTVEVPLEFRATADSFPLAIALGVVDGFEQVQGHIDGEITATGIAGATALGGGLSVANGSATWMPVGVRYHDVDATLRVMQDRIFFVDARARSSEPRQRSGVLRAADGTARVTGRIDFADPGDPQLDLRLLADNLLAANRRDVVVTASGDAYLRGTYRSPIVSATLHVDGGALYIDELYRQYLVVGLDSPLLFDVVDTTLVSVRRVLPSSENPFLRNLVVRDTRVTVGSGSWLRSHEMNVEVTGDLTVALDRRRDDITLTGTLEAQRGTYDLTYPPFTRRFDVREGTVEFAGTPGIDPALAITAVYRARSGLEQGEPIDILAQLTGSLQAPRVHLTSEEQPPISESDLASYLFFGVPTYALNISGGNRGGGLTDLGFNALGPSVLGSVASGLQTLAQRFGVVDYVGLTAAESSTLASRQASRFNLISGTNLEVGRYWGPVYIAATQRLDPGFHPGFRAEWTLNPTFTAELFGEDRFAREPGFGALQSAALRRVYGFSLFREWSY
ncbi:MAG: translocation/assembly module TamB domain-containing protein, partial [Longimicrobiales bacterium]